MTVNHCKNKMDHYTSLFIFGAKTGLHINLYLMGPCPNNHHHLYLPPVTRYKLIGKTIYSNDPTKYKNKKEKKRDKQHHVFSPPTIDDNPSLILLAEPRGRILLPPFPVFFPLPVLLPPPFHLLKLQAFFALLLTPPSTFYTHLNLLSC